MFTVLEAMDHHSPPLTTAQLRLRSYSSPGKGIVRHLKLHDHGLPFFDHAFLGSIVPTRVA